MRRLIDDRVPPHLGSALNPVDIISRANGYVREDAERKTRRVTVKPRRAPIFVDAQENDDDFDARPADTLVLPTAKSRRRPLRLALSRARRIALAGLRYGTGVAVLIVLPVWLWSSGNIDEASAFIEREARTWKAWATDEFELRLSSVRVQGRSRTGAAELRAALGVDPGTAMLDIDLASVQTRLEALPWVASATVERRLPNRLIIRLAERTPIARIRDGEEIHLVDETGTVIQSAAAEADASLVLLSGDGAAAAAAPLIALLGSRPAIGNRVTAAQRLGSRRWDLTFDSGVVVRLPASFEREAWRKLDELHGRHGLLDREIAVMDMRLPDRLIIMPAERPQADAGQQAGEG